MINPLLESFVAQPSNPDVLQVLAQHVGGLLAYHASTLANMETGGDQGYDEAYWQSRNPRRVLDTVVDHHIPAFLVGGWFDLFQRGEPLNFSGLQNLWSGRGVGKPMNPHQEVTGRYQLMMGPWYHVTAGEGVDMNRIELAWFDRWLKGRDTGIDRTRTPLHLYQLGSGKWLDASRYPLDQARPRTYYLGDGGSLSTSTPGDDGGSDSVVFTGLSSPCGRATEQWGAGLLQIALEGAGGTDPCAEDDSTTQVGPGAVTYTTAPLESPRVLAGPIDATLFAKSTRPDTELVVTLEDVDPDGGSTPLTSGALLGSFREVDESASWTAENGRPLLPYHPYTRASQEPVPTGKTTRFDVEVFPTFAKLDKGHRLRVTIATSEVPHLMPTPAQTARLAGGVYDIQHNAKAASFLELPLAPADEFAKPCGLCRP